MLCDCLIFGRVLNPQKRQQDLRVQGGVIVFHILIAPLEIKTG